MQEEPQRADSYRYAVQPQIARDNRAERIEALQRKRKLKKTKEELETLKDELDMVSQLFLLSKLLACSDKLQQLVVMTVYHVFTTEIHNVPSVL